MDVSVWSSGKGTYGIRVGFANRDKYFVDTWRTISVEIDSEVHQFRLTPGFWRHCPEFRDSGSTVIRDWLRGQGKLKWEPGQPPKFTLMVLGDGQFRLLTQ